jgi:hypothetical protein
VLRRLFLAGCFALLPLAAGGQALEPELKAAYLYRFLGFIEWPPAALAPGAQITIGVLGADEVLADLEGILPGRTAQGRAVTARRVREGEPLEGVQLLFVGRAAAAALPRLAGPPGMVVASDAVDALDRGAAIAFVRSEGRVRFHVALDNAERQGVRISSRMLSVAEYVRGRRL